MRTLLPLLLASGPLMFACAPEPVPAQVQDSTCTEVPASFLRLVHATLTDSTGLFAGDFPPVTPLSCELLLMLQEELKDDSARHHFERFSRRYWRVDPHATRTHAYIRRHVSFPLAMAATAHWYADTRIEGLRELQAYRRIRPMVCATKEHYAQLERQDRAAVRYLIRVLESTPLCISGSENATIHSIYIRTVMETLDLFTGQHHMTSHADDLLIHRSALGVQQYIADRRKWMEQ